MKSINITANTLNALEYKKILETVAEKAVSSAAKEMALALRPSADRCEISRLLDETDAARVLSVRRSRPPFYGVRDLKGSVKRAEAGAMLSMAELLQVADLLRNAYTVREYRENCESTVLDCYFSRITPNKYLEKLITSAIVNEEEMADSASPELLSIRRKIRQEELGIREALNRLIHSSASKFLQEPIITQKNGRFTVPVRSEYRREIAGMVQDTSSSGSTVFIEPMSVVEANNSIRILLNRERAETERILYMLSAEVAGFGSAILLNLSVLSELDFIFAKADYAESINAVKPVLSEKKGIDFQQARHPLISKDKVVAVDITLGKDYDLLVITGPNTGGKTVCLKTAGLLCMMLQSGLHIPVKEGSSASVFSNIYTDIGDEQSIEQSLSTFSSHMTNIVDILDKADEDSLVLLDELGAGTDPVEGAALAVSILQYLLRKKILSAASTHYPELKLFALETDRVQNASLEFDIESLRPTYRLITGIPGKSNAFAIAGRLGLSVDIIEQARHEVRDSSAKLELIIQKLHNTQAELDRKLKAAEQANIKAQQLKKENETLREQIEKNAEKETQNAIKNAKKIVEDARFFADKLLDELRDLKKEKDREDFSKRISEGAVKAKTELNALEDIVNPEEKYDNAYVLPRSLRVGDSVKIAGLEGIYTVAGLKDKNGMVAVLSGNIKTKVPEDRLRLTKTKSKNPLSNAASVRKSSAGARSELDIRGKTVLEAEQELSEFIDSAVAAGLGSVTVIHGKGTGALRSGVHEYLRAYTGIKSFRLGKYGEGEDGVTIIEI